MLSYLILCYATTKIIVRVLVFMILIGMVMLRPPFYKFHAFMLCRIISFNIIYTLCNCDMFLLKVIFTLPLYLSSTYTSLCIYAIFLPRVISM